MTEQSEDTNRQGHRRAWRAPGALRHRNYQLYFGGQGISEIGTFMQVVAQSWLVYRLTGSSVLLGAVGFVSQIPILLLGPLAGHVVDRHRRQRVFLTVQISFMLLAFILSALTLTNTVRVWHVFVLAAIQGVLMSFDGPARQSFAVCVVGREDLASAIALNSSLRSAGRIVGPAVAGLLLAKLGEGWCFLANGVSYMAVICGLLLMTVREERRETHGSAVKSIWEGARYVAQSRPMRALLMLLALANIVAMSYVTLMPIFANRVLHGGPKTMGLLIGASGVGAVGGMVRLAFRKGVKGLSNWVMWCTIGMGVSLIGFAISRSFWLSMALLLPVGAFAMVENAGTNTLIQSMIPDRVRGRVMSVFTMMTAGMAPFGALLGGFLGQQFGAPVAVAMMGAACLAGGITFAIVLPGMKPELGKQIRAQQIVVPVPQSEA